MVEVNGYITAASSGSPKKLAPADTCVIEEYAGNGENSCQEETGDHCSGSETHIFQFPQDNKIQRKVENESLESFSLQTDPAGLLLDADKHIGSDESEYIHQTIPSKLEWTDLNDGWIDVRIRQHDVGP